MNAFNKTGQWLKFTLKDFKKKLIFISFKFGNPVSYIQFIYLFIYFGHIKITTDKKMYPFKVNAPILSHLRTFM